MSQHKRLDGNEVRASLALDGTDDTRSRWDPSAVFERSSAEVDGLKTLSR